MGHCNPSGKCVLAGVGYLIRWLPPPPKDRYVLVCTQNTSSHCERVCVKYSGLSYQLAESPCLLCVSVAVTKTQFPTSSPRAHDGQSPTPSLVLAKTWRYGRVMPPKRTSRVRSQGLPRREPEYLTVPSFSQVMDHMHPYSGLGCDT